MAEIHLEIDGMHCGACVRRVSQALGALEGVQVDEVVVGSARITAPEAGPAIEALAKIGFTARATA